MSAPGIIVAAAGSGSGKTTLTFALAHALHRRGHRLRMAKAGPDYIDPGFHAAASGWPCVNLDVWAMRPATLAGLVAAAGSCADLVICEGVMGLFDGVDATGRGSTAELAGLTGWPVVLVVDAGGMAASAAALVHGLAHPPGSLARPGVRVAGVIFNRVGGPGHVQGLRDAMRSALPDIPVLGAVPRRDDLVLPARHLGLVPAGERPDLAAFLATAAKLVAEHVDLEAFVATARPSQLGPTTTTIPPLPPLGQRIAVARDDAFAFAYPAVLDGWRDAGAALSMFSPLADESPAAGCDAIYLPGGYPELHAGVLAGARHFRDGLQDAAARGAVIYGECGGYMMLGDGLVDAHGVRHAMAGLLPVTTSFATRRLHLGYREVSVSSSGPLGAAGTAYRGHEFHYASVVEEGDGEPLFTVADARGQDLLAPAGRRRGTTFGSFIHLIDREIV